MQQEVETAAQEVSDAIEQELAQGEETYHYPPITLLEENRGGNYTEVGAELRNNPGGWRRRCAPSAWMPRPERSSTPSVPGMSSR